jgi:16S rRNA G966 N2-methylase RsmD
MEQMTDPVAEATLFDTTDVVDVAEATAAQTLAEKFVVPPVSILDRRSGEWQARRRRWLSLGIKSEEGRAEELTFNRNLVEKYGKSLSTTSIFDPVFCEIAYRWFSLAGDRVLDPFSGGSVRGVVSSILGRPYVGVDLRDEQVDANLEQLEICKADCQPRWLLGDSLKLPEVLADNDDGGEFDLIFSCPPYADLEKYSDDSRDISNMSYEDFTRIHNEVIALAASMLRPNRFAVWVISEVRDRRTGIYRGLVADTVTAFKAAGLGFYNDLITLDPMGSAPVRAEGIFRASRKAARVHQNFLVFIKGDPREASARLEGRLAAEGRRPRIVSVNGSPTIMMPTALPFEWGAFDDDEDLPYNPY